jgi:hypothetical protein
MKFEHTRVMNFEGAFRGLRNPKESWDRSDSYFGIIDSYSTVDYDIAELWARKEHPECYKGNLEDHAYEIMELEAKYDRGLLKNGILREDSKGLYEVAFIGPNDMKLAQQLIKAGSEHRKFMRQIFVSVDITAPLFFFKELDTYKVGTVANSTSTMHKLASTPITIDCFETDDMKEIENWTDEKTGYEFNQKQLTETFISALEGLRQKYNETKDIKYWKELIRWLPESWLQTRTITMNYENLLNICSKGQRRNHKLNEWSGIHTPVEQSFIQWARTLPYAQVFIFLDEIS